MFILTGTITDHAGVPRAGVEVQIAPLSHVSVTDEAVAVGMSASPYTDALGRFEVELVAREGLVYQVMCRAIGFSVQVPAPPAGTTLNLRDVTPVMVPSPLVPVVRGLPGKSTYEIAVEQGFEGTEEQWLEAQRPEAPALTATATALPPGAEPTATITGTYPDLTLDLGIPKADSGTSEPVVKIDTDGVPYFVIGRNGIALDIDGRPYITIGD